MPPGEKKLPPLHAMTAFEASARHLSFTRAALELHLSQSAVSRQIQGLEQQLGAPLFERQHKNIALTRAGVIFYETVSQSLTNIRQSVQDIRNLSSSRVTIAATTGMASFCLIPAILRFRQQHPEVYVQVLATDDAIDPRREFIDFSIRYGDGNFPGFTTIKLFEEEIFPVCSKSYLEKRGIRKITDLSQEVLIDFNPCTSPYGTWADWLHRAHIGRPKLNIGLQFSSHDLVYRAMCSGAGVALCWAYTIPADVRETLLTRPMNVTVKTGMSEYIVYPAGKRLGSAASAVLQCLRAHAQHQPWSVAA